MTKTKMAALACAAALVLPAAANARCEFYEHWDFGGGAVSLQPGECVIFDPSESRSSRNDSMCQNYATQYESLEFQGNVSSARVFDGATVGLKWYENGSPVVEVSPFDVPQMGPNMNDRIVAATCS